MPIRPENRGRYPADWREISQRIRFERAGGRCECDGRCGRDRNRPEPAPGTGPWQRTDHLGADGRCVRRHGAPLPSGRPVVLTTAHLDHTPEHCDDANLMAMCQGCHLHYDRDHHAETAAATRTAAQLAVGQLDMFGGVA